MYNFQINIVSCVKINTMCQN